MPHARIIAAAKYLPEKVVTNEDLVEQYGFPHPAWFDRSAAGVKERRFAAPGETTVDMGAAALRALVEQTGLRDKPVDLLLMTTCSFEQAGPSAAMHVAQRVGLRPTLCFDLVGACAAFAAAMDVANQYLSSGAASRVIIVASELQSPHMYFGPDGDHYKFAGIFGDGAGAVLLERSDEVGIEGAASSAPTTSPCRSSRTSLRAGCCTPARAECRAPTRPCPWRCACGRWTWPGRGWRTSTGW
jgi:3-oxoacyl-[acyl-carrier-protein] synthase III